MCAQTVCGSMGLLFVVNMHVCVFVPMSLYVIVVMDEDYAADSVFICVHFCVCVRQMISCIPLPVRNLTPFISKINFHVTSHRVGFIGYEGDISPNKNWTNIFCVMC